MAAAHCFRRLDLFVTEACNLACPYCFTRGRSRRHGPGVDQTLRAVDWLLGSESRTVHLTLWGGEPLLRLDLLRRTVKHARRESRRLGKRLTLSMPTNATLLDGDAVAWLVENRIQVFCSLDGEGDAERPLSSSGESSHAMAMEGLRRALASPQPARPAVRMTVTPENAACQADNAAHFIGAGVDQLLLYPAMDLRWTAGELRAFAAGQTATAAMLVELFEKEPDPRRVPVFKAWRPILRRLLRPAARAREGRLMDQQCGAGTELIALSADGAFAPCHRFVFYDNGPSGPRHRLGQLSSASGGGPDLAAAAVFDRLQIGELRGEQGRCVDCELFDLCGFGCVAISFATTGDLCRVPAWVCSLMRAQVEACREVHRDLAGDPRYALYLDFPLAEALKEQAREVADLARRHYQEIEETEED